MNAAFVALVLLAGGGTLAVAAEQSTKFKVTMKRKDDRLKDGYFKVTLPRAFFEGNPKSMTLKWIDFCRQRAKRRHLELT